MHIDKAKLYKNFIDIKNIANINLLACYKVLFSKNGILYNYGSFILIALILAHFIIILIFYIKNSFKSLKQIIHDISFGIMNMNLIQDKGKKIESNIKNNNEDIKYKKEKKKKRKRKIKKNKRKSGENNEFKSKSNTKNNPQKKKNRMINLKENLEKNNKKMNSKNMISNVGLQTQFTKGNSKYENQDINNKHSKENIDNVLKKTKKIMAFNDEELNGLSYEQALKYDKRNYCQYYFSLLKTKHIILFTFCNSNDYNSKIIKIDLFLFNLAFFISINALFFSDETMHKIHEDKGIYNFIFQLPQIIYSSLISFAFGSFFELLALSQDLILNFKEQKTLKMLNQRIIFLKRRLKIKFLLYFIFSSIFLLFFWYYLSMFCAIYKNTQIHLIKDTLFSFIFSLITPFFFYLVPGFLRIPALSNEQNKRIILYNISKFIQIF